jgi:aminopeptidase N
MAADPDSFARWDAGQELARRVLLRLCDDAVAGRELVMDPRLLAAAGGCWPTSGWTGR